MSRFAEYTRSDIVVELTVSAWTVTEVRLWARRVTSVACLVAFFGWPLYITQSHSDLTRAELRIDAYTHGAALVVAIVAAAVWWAAKAILDAWLAAQSDDRPRR